MSALDKVLEAYRDMFGVKTEAADATHRDACIEVAALRAANERLKEALEWIVENDPKGNGDAYWYAEQCGARAAAALDAP